MFEAFFIKLIGFKRNEKFGSVTGSTIMGGPAKFKSFLLFNLCLD